MGKHLLVSKTCWFQSRPGELGRHLTVGLATPTMLDFLYAKSTPPISAFLFHLNQQYTVYL
jgi:hypothetical protein